MLIVNLQLSLIVTSYKKILQTELCDGYVKTTGTSEHTWENFENFTDGDFHPALSEYEPFWNKFKIKAKAKLEKELYRIVTASDVMTRSDHRRPLLADLWLSISRKLSILQFLSGDTFS